ncbi:MAG: methyltransferase domain-containing protein [Magnetococcales bacterium]|nr:methyltransferase domain-containing protein [Magnetococcales bacterium]
MGMENHVRDRYSEGATKVVEALCCPVSYDAGLLKILPKEIIDRDYGCGDPSSYVKKGDTVLDLGSGGGKICYMAAQLVGEGGKVIGIDMNDDMLALARKYQDDIAKKLGEDRVVFHKGRIQDLSLSLDRVSEYLAANNVIDLESADAFDAWVATQRSESPMIEDNSVDLVISNCVLNLVDDAMKWHMVEEIFRVVKPGGRVAISDIVSDVLVPEELKADPELWSGCISGAFVESELIEMFGSVGFTAVAFDKWDEKPWQIVDDIEFRSVTLTATKPLSSTHEEQLDMGHGVIYRGPMAVVEDELGNVFPAGVRIAVSQQVFERLGMAPFAEQFILLSPENPPNPALFTASPGTIRHPTETRGGKSMFKSDGGCGPSSGCC